MQISKVFHQIASEGSSNFLKEIAEKFGWSEDEVIIVAVNRMYRDTFHPNAEFDYPTDKELAHWEKLGLIDRSKTPVEGAKIVSNLKDILSKHE